MSYLAGLLFMILGLIISVALHEVGHLLPAKRFGAVVPEYWIGFGPRLFSRKVGGTEYGIKAILLGGYVRILGMFPPGKELAPDGGVRLTMVQEARLQSREELESARAAGLSGKPFYRLRTGQKLAVMLGGPLMNLLLAFVITTATIMGIGWSQPTTTIDQVVPTNSELGITENGTDPTPALAAGLQPGDTLLAWDGTAIETWEQTRTLIAQMPKSGADVVVERGGQTVETHVVPVLDKDDVPRIGIIIGQERARGSLGDSLQTTGALFTGTAGALVRLPVSLWDLIESFFTGAERDPAGVMSVIGVARVAGEVTSAEPGTSVTLMDRLAMLLSLLASLNMALFVFNLIPLPPLDGGHIAGALWGGVKNLYARLRGLPRPAPPDTARMVPLANGVFLALIAMSIVLMGADLFKPLHLF